MAILLKHQTLTQFAAGVRERYRNASREDAAKIAAWILRHILNGDLTDTQVRNAFGLNAAQWTTLKAKMQTLVDHYEAVQVAQGE